MAQNGKAFNEYMHQAAPSGPVEHFSDKPIKVDGVRYQPKWAWSDGYRKHFRAMHSNRRRDCDVYCNVKSPEHASYRNWLCLTRGMAKDEADRFINQQRR